MHLGSLGSYLQEAPVIIDKPEIVYVIENQSVTITVTLNHVNAAVIWKRYVSIHISVICSGFCVPSSKLILGSHSIYRCDVETQILTLDFTVNCETPCF